MTVFDRRAWIPLADLPEPRVGAGAFVLPDGRFFLFGGEHDHVPVASTLALDPATNTWSSARPMPNPQAHMAVASLNGRVYLFGGTDERHGQDVLIFDPATDTWTNGEPIPIPLSHAAAASVGGAIYLFGGRSGEAHLSTTYRYDPAADRWDRLADMPVVGSSISATVVRNRVWIIGAVWADGTSRFGSIPVYAPAADEWTPVPLSRPVFAQSWHSVLPLVYGPVGALCTSASIRASGGRISGRRGSQDTPTRVIAAKDGILEPKVRSGIELEPATCRWRILSTRCLMRRSDLTDSRSQERAILRCCWPSAASDNGGCRHHSPASNCFEGQE